MKPRKTGKGFSFSAEILKQAAALVSVLFLIFPAVITECAFINAQNYTESNAVERLKKSAAQSKGKKGKACLLFLSEIPWLILAALAAAGAFNIINKFSLSGAAAACIAAAGIIVIAAFLEYRYSLCKSALIILTAKEEIKGDETVTE